MADAKVLYAPALRMKAGELQGIRELAPDVADRVLPRMIVPPPAERDEALQPRLLESAAYPDIGGPLATYWGRRNVLVEASYLLDEYGRDRLGLWLPKMFERARAAGVGAIPLVKLKDLLADDLDAYAQALDHGAALKFGLVISSNDLGNRDEIARGLDALSRLRLSPDQCLIIADFHDADLSIVDVVAPIIGAALEDLKELAPWQQVIFQGTNFPEKNPAEPGSYKLVPRTEWLSWRRAVSFDPQTADYMIFGDYAADCSKLSFDGGRGMAIRHYRYATPDAWLVQRGAKSGAHEEVMRKVCSEILASGVFAGRTFSSGDDYIYRTAKNAGGPGNAKDWRAVNTTHHITRVVTDVGAVKSVRFNAKVVEELESQPPLFS